MTGLLVLALAAAVNIDTSSRSYFEQTQYGVGEDYELLTDDAGFGDATLDSVFEADDVFEALVDTEGDVDFKSTLVRSEESSFVRSEAALVEADVQQSAQATTRAGLKAWRLPKWTKRLQADGKKIGRGAFGAVIQGKLDCNSQVTDVQRVAVKVLNTKEGDVTSEVNAMAIFNTPQFVTLYSHGPGPKRDGYSIMMEKCESDLTSFFPRNFKGKSTGRKATIPQILRFTAEILDALDQLHNRGERSGEGIVHRDLKPDNVLVKCVDKDDVETCHAKIADLGLTCAATSRQARRDGMQVCGCGRNGCSGTPLYLAPETWGRGASQGPASDNYAVGLFLYEFLFSTRPPFADSISIAELGRAITTFDFTGRGGRNHGESFSSLYSGSAGDWPAYLATEDGEDFKQLMVTLLSLDPTRRTDTRALYREAHRLAANAGPLPVATVEPIAACVCLDRDFGALGCEDREDVADEEARLAELAEERRLAREAQREAARAKQRERERARREERERRRAERERRGQARPSRPSSVPEPPVEPTLDLDLDLDGRGDGVLDVSRGAALDDSLSGDEYIVLRQVDKHVTLTQVFGVAKAQVGVPGFEEPSCDVLDCMTQKAYGTTKRNYLPPAMRNGCWMILTIGGFDVEGNNERRDLWLRNERQLKDGMFGKDVTVKLREVKCHNMPAEMRQCERKIAALAAKPAIKKGRRY